MDLVKKAKDLSGGNYVLNEIQFTKNYRCNMAKSAKSSMPTAIIGLELVSLILT